MKVAALDLGTNTFLLLIAEIENGRVGRVIHDEVRVVRLGQGVHQAKKFHPEALARADECFAAFAKTIKRTGVDRIRACATSAARDVANGNELIELGAKYSIPIEIISGEKEAELTFSGTVSETPTGPLVIIDVGGGSTELILGGPSGLTARTSVDVGSVRLTEMFVTQHPISNAELWKMSSYIDTAISKGKATLPSSDGAELIAVAGTPTTLATLDQGLPFESSRVDGYLLPQKRLSTWVKRLADMTVEQRQALAGMEPKRADVIVAGALILQLAAESFSSTDLRVSTRGLRYGVARELGEE